MFRWSALRIVHPIASLNKCCLPIQTNRIFNECLNYAQKSFLFFQLPAQFLARTYCLLSPLLPYIVWDLRLCLMYFVASSNVKTLARKVIFGENSTRSICCTFSIPQFSTCLHTFFVVLPQRIFGSALYSNETQRLLCVFGFFITVPKSRVNSIRDI